MRVGACSQVSADDFGIDAGAADGAHDRKITMNGFAKSSGDATVLGQGKSCL